MPGRVSRWLTEIWGAAASRSPPQLTVGPCGPANADTSSDFQRRHDVKVKMEAGSVAELAHPAASAGNLPAKGHR